MKEINLKKTYLQQERNTWQTIGENKLKQRTNISNNSKLKELRNKRMTWTNGELRYVIYL